MRMLKRVVAGLAAAVLTLGLLTACGSDKGTPQNWAESNLAKVFNADMSQKYFVMDYTVTEGDDTGTEKYSVYKSGTSRFIGSHEHGWLSDYDFDGMTYGTGKIVNHTNRTYKVVDWTRNPKVGTLYSGTLDEKAVCVLRSVTASGYYNRVSVVMTGEKKYKGKAYHTESISLTSGKSGEKYDYTFYYASKDADKPSYLCIEGVAGSCILKINEFEAVVQADLGEEYASLLTIDNSYVKES